MALVTLIGTCVFFYDLGYGRGKGVPWSSWVLQSNSVIAIFMAICSLSYMGVFNARF